MASLMTFLVLIVLALLHLTQSAATTHTQTGTYLPIKMLIIHEFYILFRFKYINVQ